MGRCADRQGGSHVGLGFGTVAAPHMAGSRGIADGSPRAAAPTT